MAVTLPATGSGTATPVIATDQITGEEYQLIKLGIGAAGAFTLLTGGSGTVGAGTARVTLATDVALPAGTNAIGKLAANSGVDIGDVDVTSVNGFAAHDASIAGNPLTIGGVSSAAAPTDVSADQEAVRAWFLRNGAQATVVTAAGALIGGDATNGLDVDVTRVSGNVTVVQATASNLNTTEASGSAIKTAVEIMDDWDESDRAKVNLIVGQAGIAAGNGASGATVPRVTIANDSTGVIATVSTVTTVSTVSALGTGTTGPQKAEDVGHSTGDMGIYMLGVRDDSPAVHSGADNDYESLHISGQGGLWTSPMPPTYEVALNSEIVKKYYTSAGAVTDGIVWSPAGGKRWQVGSMFVNVSAACTVTFEDDLVAGDSAVMKMELAANSGFTLNFDPPLASGEDAADLLVTTSAGNIYVTITGAEV